MLIPLASAMWNGKILLASALGLTMVASMRHWRLVQYQTVSVLWHNLDRLGMLMVLVQVDPMFWPVLVFLFVMGAVLLRMRVETCVWGGGAGRVSRSVLPFRAQRWHFWCHLLCRYIAFWACCVASGHVNASSGGDGENDSERYVQLVQVLQIIIYSALYLIHIHVLYDPRPEHQAHLVSALVLERKLI